ncbi:dihydroorotase family protein [uncultured Devosia sp.]|uniref:dihydroorotase n=1 Tax=uncultured Devosia sp. TaxID=211434 RepID=UPI0035CACB0C
MPLGLHNEDQELVASTTKRFIAEGRTTPLDHSASRPPVAELTATANFLQLAAATSAHAHIVHISIVDGFGIVAAYRARGVHATAEMCVHYLLFDADADMARLGGMLKVNPPIRSGEMEKLWEVLERGDATFISSDHSAWPLERKQTASIFDVAAGMPGLEAMVPAFFTAAAKRYGVEGAARISADYLSDRPARFFSLSTKGRLEAGYDADVVVLAPQAMTYDAKRNPRGPGWSAYDGQSFSVTPAATFVRGQQAWDGKSVATVSGHYVPRTA